MNLAIDVGNTLIKLGLFDFGHLKLKKVFPKEDLFEVLDSIEKTYPDIQHVIAASVGKLTEKQIARLKRENFISLTSQTPVPFQNYYGSPETLGVDRMALVAASAIQFPNQNALIIDLGTCITYDFINSDNEYLGGGISPGILMRYKAVNNYTSNLPLLEPKHVKSYIGNTTANSLHSGILLGTLKEIEGFIASYKKDFSSLTVILTGGDAHFLRDCLKNDIFANPNFLLEGLNHILEYNTTNV